jgi:tetrahydromethanopterin S-methyltransferase subunit C
MLATQTYKIPVSLTFQDPLENHLEICRLLAAAVVNPGFCQLLLTCPELALEHGYQGELFSLDEQERALVISIRAASLAELARQIGRALGGQPGILAKHSVLVDDFVDR